MARALIAEGAPLVGAQPDADLNIGPEPIQGAVVGHQAWPEDRRNAALTC